MATRILLKIADGPRAGRPSSKSKKYIMGIKNAKKLS
jgi:hypothetical protein